MYHVNVTEPLLQACREQIDLVGEIGLLQLQKNHKRASETQADDRRGRAACSRVRYDAQVEGTFHVRLQIFRHLWV